MTTVMTLEEAEAVLAETAWYSPTDWNEIEETLYHLEDHDEQAEVATAMAVVWREYGKEPWFMQPSGTLVDLVKDIIGEPD